MNIVRGMPAGQLIVVVGQLVVSEQVVVGGAQYS
jgi:hypothetical protein